MANYKIEEIEGIGEALGKKLREAGVSSTDKLLKIEISTEKASRRSRCFSKTDFKICKHG